MKRRPSDIEVSPLRRQAADALRRAGIDPGRRPQTLQIVEIARLVDVFTAAAK